MSINRQPTRWHALRLEFTASKKTKTRPVRIWTKFIDNYTSRLEKPLASGQNVSVTTLADFRSPSHENYKTICSENWHACRAGSLTLLA